MGEIATIGEAVKIIMTKPMKARVAFRIAVDTKPLREIVNEFDAQRRKLAEKYGEPLEGGGVQVPMEKAPAYRAEMLALLNEDLDLPAFSLKLADIEDLELPAVHVAALAPYIVEA